MGAVRARSAADAGSWCGRARAAGPAEGPVQEVDAEGQETGSPHPQGEALHGESGPHRKVNAADAGQEQDESERGEQDRHASGLGAGRARRGLIRRQMRAHGGPGGCRGLRKVRYKVITPTAEIRRQTAHSPRKVRSNSKVTAKKMAQAPGSSRMAPRIAKSAFVAVESM